MDFVIPFGEEGTSNYTSNICELEEYKQLYDRASKACNVEYDYMIKLACVNEIVSYLKQKYTSNIE